MSPVSNCKNDTVVCYISQHHFKRKQNALLKNFFPELQVGTRHKELLDIDSSSVILEDGITKLNTIGHYEVRRRASPAQTRLDPVQDCANSLKITRFPPVFWNHLKIACFRGRNFPYLLVVWDLLSRSCDFHGVQSLSILWFRSETSPLPDPPACSVEEAC